MADAKAPPVLTVRVLGADSGNHSRRRGSEPVREQVWDWGRQ